MQNEQVIEGMKVKTKDGKFWFVGKNHFADIWYLRPIDDTKQQVLHSAAFFEPADYGNSVLPKNEFRPNIGLRNKTMQVPQHYDNTKGSLYLFAEQHKLNAWEFDVLKRTIRCRKKGEFISDIDKTIAVLELYKKEYQENNQ